MKATSGALRTHLDGTVTSLATIWRIIRTDTTNFYFTDHDIDIDFDDGEGSATYLAESGYTRTAVANNASLSVDNMDVEGLLSNDGIKETELRAGLFDYAEVRISMVNWDDLTQGALKLRKGHLGEVILTPSGVFRSEMRGLTSQLSQQIVDSYQPECRVDLGSPECGVPIRPPLLTRNKAVSLGEIYRVSTVTPGSLIEIANAVVNPSFEADGLSNPVNPLTGWSIDTGSVRTVSSFGGLSPIDGSAFLAARASTGPVWQVSQDIDILNDLGIVASSTDNGDTIASFSIYSANIQFLADLRIVVQFLDSVDAFISNMFVADESQFPRNAWLLRSVSDVTLPVGCRKLRITLEDNDGTFLGAAFDHIVLPVTGFDGPPGLESQYENRMYEVIDAGTTDGTQPAYDTDVGDPTVDGTATLEAQESWTRSGIVETVTNNFIFTANIVESRAVNDWFNGGVLQFNGGENAGYRVEVKDWVESTGKITLFLAAPFTINVGDDFAIYPGCNKSITECKNKFDNVINYRGEPHVPGQDTLTSYPDAG